MHTYGIQVSNPTATLQLVCPHCGPFLDLGGQVALADLEYEVEDHLDRAHPLPSRAQSPHE